MTRETRIGQRFILVSMLIESLYPTLIHAGATSFPPIWFAAVSTLLSAVINGCIVLYRGRWGFRWKFVWPWIGLTLFVPVLPAVCIVLGTQLTSGINTALLLQSELLFAFLICSLFFGERMLPLHSLGAAFVLGGTLMVLFQGSFSLQPGDLLIVLGVSFYPWGNMCAKKLLKSLDPFQVLFLRSSLGGLLLLCISLAVEGSPFSPFASGGALWLIPAYAIIILVLSKLIWYEGLRSTQLLKATSLIMATPALGVIVAALSFREVPTLFHIGGFIMTLCGLFLLTRRPSVL